MFRNDAITRISFFAQPDSTGAYPHPAGGWQVELHMMSDFAKRDFKNTPNVVSITDGGCTPKGYVTLIHLQHSVSECLAEWVTARLAE